MQNSKFMQLVFEGLSKGEISKELAYQLIKNSSSSNNNAPNNARIAVVGLSCYMPEASDKNQFWKNLISDRDSVISFPKQRREAIDPLLQYFGADKESDEPYRTGGFVEQVGYFDNHLFGITDAEAILMDPQQRIFLELVVSALEDAGYMGERIVGSKTGVFVAPANSTYKELINDEVPLALAGNMASILAGRVSYHFDLRGPNLVVETACSSSLVAVHQACQSIILNECQLAIAGGINLDLFPLKRNKNSLDVLGLVSEHQKCRPFDAKANGIINGEGGGVVILKSLDAAIKDQDNIYAIIETSVINHDGHSSSLSAPNPEAQTNLLIEAWKKANINPRELSFIEAHGTGTKLGDPIEITALNRAFKRFTNDKKFCGIGSLKSNIGHLLDGAAGIAGLIKVILSLKHGKIPASLHFEQPNPLIDFDQSAVFVNHKLTEWKPVGDSRLAGISCFGFSGTNCHLVLRDFESQKPNALEASKPSLFVLSTDREQDLKDLIRKFRKHLLENHVDKDLHSICYTLATGRKHRQFRLAIICNTLHELLEKLETLLLESESDIDPVKSEIFLSTFKNLNLSLYKKPLQKEACEFVLGQKHSLTHLFDKEHPKLSLPTTPFNRKYFWIPFNQSIKKLSQKIGKVESVGSHKEPPQTVENPVEKLLNIFKQCIGNDNITLADDFFSLGGDSLLAVQIVNEINQVFSTDISYTNLLKNSKLEELLKFIEGEKQTSQTSLTRYSRMEYPLSFAQHRLWMLEQMQDTPTAYIMSDAYKIEDRLDIDCLKKSLNFLVERHEVFRTYLKNSDNGDAVQKIAQNQEADFIFEECPLKTDNEINLRLNEFAHIPFDLMKGPLLRVLVLKLQENVFILAYAMHHIISDGWSMSILTRDLFAIYDHLKDKTALNLPTLAIQYGDYCLWQREKLTQQIQNAETYWTKKLANLSVCEIQGDKTRPVVFNFSGKRRVIPLTETLSKQIQNSAKNQQITLFMFLVANVYILINKYSGSQDLVIGSPISGREHKQLNDLVGCFVNTLAIRTSLDNASVKFSEFLQDVKQSVLEAFDHQQYPFDRLVNLLNPSRDTSRSPIFNINVALQDFQSIADIKSGFKKSSRIDLTHDSAKWDLEFEFVVDAQQNISCHLEYYQDLYSDKLIDQIVSHLKIILEETSLNAESKICEILSSTLLKEYQPAQFSSVPNVSLVDLFEKTAKKYSEQIALTCHDQAWNYKKLNEEANQVAHFLINKKVGSEEKIGILANQSPYSIIAMLGTLKAGCSYIPLNTQLPLEKLKQIINDSELRIILTQSSYLDTSEQLQLACPNVETVLCMDTNGEVCFNDTSELMNEELWNHVANSSTDEITASGWVSSYTGKPFTSLEMKEYKDNVYRKLQPHITKTTRVLEVGCGSGLTCFTLAPHVASYCATDLSKGILEKNRKKAEENKINNIKFLQMTADQIDQLGNEKFDLIILNSVVHCFPNYQYLRHVLHKASHLLTENGKIFLGDLMDLNKKEKLSHSLHEFKLQKANSLDVTKTDLSRELFVNSEFLNSLPYIIPEIANIEISDKFFTIENELTNFRFDALVTFEKSKKSSFRPNTDVRKEIAFQNMLLEQPTKNLNVKISTHHLAYILYTSGSTGVPKGVMIEHASIVNYITWAANYYFTSQQKADSIFYSSFAFDLTLTSLWLPFLKGGTLHVIPGGFEELIESHNQLPDFHLLKLTPSHLKAIIDHRIVFPKLSKVVLGGEMLYKEQISQLIDLYSAHNIILDIYNEYGPTEATVGCITHHCSHNLEQESEVTSIGYPINNTAAFLGDSFGYPVPHTAVGELYLLGHDLARGYFNDSITTAKSFVPAPFHNKTTLRMYRTGDLGRMSTDGQMQLIGRNDRQVKINGYRVNLNEIEAAFLKHPRITLCVALLLKATSKKESLTAYYESTQEVSANELREFLSAYLPDYMIPPAFIYMKKIPVTANGKVALNKLPNSVAKEAKEQRALTETEKLIVVIWSKLLECDELSIGPDEDFFSLGGDSIVAMRLLSQLKTLGVKFVLSDIFRLRTVSAIAAQIDSKKQTLPAVNKSTSQHDVGAFALIPIQEWFFEQSVAYPNFFTMQSLFKIPDSIDEVLLERCLQSFIKQHDVFRLFFYEKEGRTVQEYMSWDQVLLKMEKYDFSHMPEAQHEKIIQETSIQIQSSFDLKQPPLIKYAIFNLGEKGKRLYITIHHLICDGVSWRYLLEDINNLYVSKLSETLPEKTDSFKTFSQIISGCEASSLQLDYWHSILNRQVECLETPCSFEVQNYELLLVEIKGELFSRLLAANKKGSAITIKDLLMTSVLLSLSNVFDMCTFLYNLEGHGRSGNALNQCDVIRTFGWFTSLFPVLFEKKSTSKDTLIHVQESFKKIDQKEIDYGIARYLMKDKLLAKLNPQILLNYFGFLGGGLLDDDTTLFTSAPEELSLSSHQKNSNFYAIAINMAIFGESLRISVEWNKELFSQESFQEFKRQLENSLAELISTTEIENKDLLFR